MDTGNGALKRKVMGTMLVTICNTCTITVLRWSPLDVVRPLFRRPATDRLQARQCTLVCCELQDNHPLCVVLTSMNFLTIRIAKVSESLGCVPLLAMLTNKLSTTIFHKRGDKTPSWRQPLLEVSSKASWKSVALMFRQVSSDSIVYDFIKILFLKRHGGLYNFIPVHLILLIPHCSTLSAWCQAACDVDDVIAVPHPENPDRFVSSRLGKRCYCSVEFRSNPYIYLLGMKATLQILHTHVQRLRWTLEARRTVPL